MITKNMAAVPSPSSAWNNLDIRAEGNTLVLDTGRVHPDALIDRKKLSRLIRRHKPLQYCQLEVRSGTRLVGRATPSKVLDGLSVSEVADQQLWYMLVVALRYHETLVEERSGRFVLDSRRCVSPDLQSMTGKAWMTIHAAEQINREVVLLHNGIETPCQPGMEPEQVVRNHFEAKREEDRLWQERRTASVLDAFPDIDDPDLAVVIVGIQAGEQGGRRVYFWRNPELFAPHAVSASIAGATVFNGDNLRHEFPAMLEMARDSFPDYGFKLARLRVDLDIRPLS